MKTPAAVTKDMERRLVNHWHSEIVSATEGATSAFPHAFPLGRAASADLRADYAAIHALTVTWQEWARGHGVELTYTSRIAKGGTRQVVPTHVLLTSVDQAATIVGKGWQERLARGRERLAVLLDRSRTLDRADAGRILRLVDGYADIDFALLLKVVDWYRADPSLARGLTHRQVPIPGVHAKWLQAHRAAVLALTGLDDLGLLANHPARIHFTYLDPDHRAVGRRLHDSATVGDTFAPAYQPEVVVISENKDTAIHFPELAGGLIVEGVGRGGRTVASFPWIREAPLVVYWGDMDRDGYEILNGYRIDFDRDLDSILMNVAAYEEFEPYGTNHDQNGRDLVAGAPRVVDHLRADELEVYLRLLHPEHSGHRRIEQERIPLTRALSEVERLVSPTN